jgi:epoxide hydrolase-like predicted phosphatase
MKNETIDAVIFDLGGVLIDHPVTRIIRYCAGTLHADPEALMRAHWKYGPDFQKGAIPEREYWRRVCSEIGTAEPDLFSLWGEAFRRAYSEREEVFSLAARLRGAGYITGLLSDTEAPAAEFFRNRRRDHFDFLVFSCEEGFLKPDERIFRIALDRSGTAPERTVFIDDLPANVEGANRVDIKGILYQEPGQLVEALIARSLKF